VTRARCACAKSVLSSGARPSRASFIRRPMRSVLSSFSPRPSLFFLLIIFLSTLSHVHLRASVFSLHPRASRSVAQPPDVLRRIDPDSGPCLAGRYKLPAIGGGEARQGRARVQGLQQASRIHASEQHVVGYTRGSAPTRTVMAVLLIFPAIF